MNNPFSDMLSRKDLGAGYPVGTFVMSASPLAAEALCHACFDWAGVAMESIAVAVDGCGVTVFGLPLANMALSYARLGHAARRGDDAPAQIVSAMTGHPFLIGGTDRFDTVLMEACEGRVLCKIGAEGVHTLAIPDQGLGIAVKVEDGAHRAQYQAVLAVLSALGALPDPLPDALRALSGKQVFNTRGEAVGEMRIGARDVGEFTSDAGASAA